MKVVVDACLSPALALRLKEAGVAAVHWSSIGAHNAMDREIVAWAMINDHSIVTADLDFGDILFNTNATKPSVIVLRMTDLAPEVVAPIVAEVLTRFGQEIRVGALVSVDEENARLRKLPFAEE